MSKKRLNVHVVLDRSGSMQSCLEPTIDAFNEYVNSLKKNKEVKTKLSLILFDSASHGSVDVDVIYDCIKIKKVPKLTKENYSPRGMTPLYDAIGLSVSRIKNIDLKKDEDVALVIITDGLENASKEWTANQIKKILAKKQNKKNWLVLYLGANQDAWSVGSGLGMTSGKVLDYDTGKIGETMGAVAQSTARYMSRTEKDDLDSSDFTQEERKSAK